MELHELENIIRKAYFFDAEPQNAILIFLFHTEEEALAASDTLIENFQGEELSIHVEYNEKVSVSIRTKKTNDIVSVKDLDCNDMTTMSLDLIMNAIRNGNHPNKDYITLACGIKKDGIFNVQSFYKSNIIGLMNIKELTMQFVK